jgi:hypothetical protein
VSGHRIFNLITSDTLVYSSGGPVNTMSYTASRILSFASLPEGWDYGEGVPPSMPIIRAAIDWERRLSSSGWQTNAGPGPMGEIAVSAVLGTFRIEVVLESDHTITVIYGIDGVRSIYRPNLYHKEAGELVRDLLTRSWHSYVSSIPGSMTRSQTSGSTSPSGTSVVHYQFSVKNAFQEQD